MGRIKKVASQKHEATISPFLQEFIAQATSLPIPELPSLFNTFPRLWPFPRGDLYHWINVLDRFDEILASAVEKYFLNTGPQTQLFTRSVLEESYSADESKKPAEGVDAKLSALGYGPDGDRELVEAILDFSRLLLEKCGNRSLYSSSDRLGDLLNTTSLSLLQSTLRLSLCLAQRYHSRQRGAHQQSVLQSHYALDLEKLQKIAAPFPRPVIASKAPFTASPAVSAKGKEKAAQTKINANELVSLVRDSEGWEEWGGVRILYYPSGSEQARTTSEFGQTEQGSHVPTTPTPLRRSATHPAPNPSRGVDETPGSTGGKGEETTRGGKVLELPHSKVSAAKVEDLLVANLPHLPLESKYELLHKARVAKALTTSRATREQILSIRALAVTNLAHVQPESTFQQKALQSDLEQPKRLQLAYQLAELVHLGASGDLEVSRSVQTLAIQALDALAKHKARAVDVCAALSVNVNHGVLMFLTRKMVNELGPDNNDPDDAYHDEWRDALLALLRTLPSSSTRTPETLVAAGLIPMFVDILNLRTEKSRRVYSRIMEFLDTFVHAVRDALSTLTTAKGFDAMSDLIDHETKTAFEKVNRGEGFPVQYKNPSVDYQIPYFQQQTLRWMFRFVNHIMQHASGGFDRVLRNLIDSPQLLTSLRLVFENARVFGSHVWSNAVNILSSFIHNEPTSYAVIAEAGLSKSLLAAVMGRELQVIEKPPAVEPEAGEPEGEAATQPPSTEAATQSEEKKKDREYPIVRPQGTPLAPGIMSAADALACIPGAFGAICLNSSGLDLFQSSDALESFFEIFENPEHVKCLKDDPELVRTLGTTFDELVRHHPALKNSIMSAVLVMAARVNMLGRVKAWEQGMGTKMWAEDSDGKKVVSGDIFSLFREIGTAVDASVEDPASFGAPRLNSNTLPNGGKLVVGHLDNVLPSPGPDFEPQDKDAHGLTATDYLFPALRFLGAFFENQTNCTSFIMAGGAEFLLDLATLQSLAFDFHSTNANQEITVLVHMLAETKPHLVVPSLVRRAQTAVDNLSAFWTTPTGSGFFTELIQPAESKKPALESTTAAKSGTFFVRHLNAVLLLTDVLREVFALPLYQTRPGQSTSIFAQANLADHYCALVSSLTNLVASCVWEGILLEKNIPEKWLKATQASADKHGSGKSKGAATSGIPQEPSAVPGAAPQLEGTGSSESAQAQPAEDTKEDDTEVDEAYPAFQNARTLRYLLSALPTSITGFLHNLGLGMIGKRRADPLQKQRQNASLVSDAIAEGILRQLKFNPANSSDSPKHRFAYLIVILSHFSHLLYEVSTERPTPNYLTCVLVAFKKNDGLQALKDICEVFLNDIKSLPSAESIPDQDKELADRLASGYGGIKIILGLFADLTAGKFIVDSSQTQALTTHHERDRERSDYFQPGQFLVELRMEILPMAEDMWNSDFATQSSSPIVKLLIDILRSSLDGEYETGAARKSDTPTALVDTPKKPFVVHMERAAALLDKGYTDVDLNKEALYRCNNLLVAAEEYCQAQQWLRAPARAPPGPNDIQTGVPEPASGIDSLEDPLIGEVQPFDHGSGFMDRSALQTILAQAGRHTMSDAMQPPPLIGGDGDADMHDGLARALDSVLNDNDAANNNNQSESSNQNPSEGTNNEGNSESVSSQAEPVKHRHMVTVEDLDVERQKIRSNLIDRALDILNEHHDVSFELSDLITSAIKKHSEPVSFRRDIGETLVQSLVSLQMENFQTAGKKIAAYAHILALTLQDRDMYLATLEELKDCFSTFLGFIKLPTPEKVEQESFPWVGHVLLILEKLLSDDCQPPKISWTSPSLEDPTPSSDEPAHLEDPLVSLDEKTQLFQALVEILPRVGKDDTLALSMCRILVILTRERSIASRFGEKRNLQRLFVMVKQLSSSTHEKLQSAFMLILRHIVEDEATIRQIMRSEIVANFESKNNRQIDMNSYLRQMHHLVLRAPDIFVEVTNEKLRFVRYDNPQRLHALGLKADKDRQQKRGRLASNLDESKPESSTAGEPSASEDKDMTKEDKSKSQAKGAELKAPVVENPDGVIHYLLSELLSYKDVDDKEAGPEASEQTGDQSDTQTDVEMAGDEPSPSASSAAEGQASRNSKKTEKPQFKAEEHPIYIYRCLLLQCLTELLASYNRTKVEFINFSRKADPLATTPSKPRSGVLNYMLNVLVPLGTMEHDETLVFKKRSMTSTWTMQVLVALCTKTGEFGGVGRRRTEPKYEEDEPELAFVRRFVLEHALRSYKDAMASTEPLDAKYSKLMSLADLFDKMLSGYSFSNDAGFPTSTRQLAKTMFEKNFIPALTSSVADVDLNFPSSKRVIKYILRPLNKLTQTAVLLSENSDITIQGDNEDDEISSATSVSDMEDEREETPDLFRHSTLGMLEPRHDEEESSTEESEGEDDEMYDDEYDEEMDYDEDIAEDDGEVVSDEDDDGMGPIEGLSGDAVEVILDEDEDDDDDDDEEHDHSDMHDDMYDGEIGGDRDNESLEDGEEDEWESEEMTEDEEEVEMMNQFEDEMADMRQSSRHQGEDQRIGDLFRALNEATGMDDLHGDGLGGDIHEEILDDLDEDVEDEDEMDELDEDMDDFDDEQGSYGDMEDDDLPEPWGWEGDEPMPRAHQSRFRGGPPPAWATVTEIMPGRPGLVPIQPYHRVHRTQMQPRGHDDGTNPLLVRNDRPDANAPPRASAADPFADWGQSMDTAGGRVVAMDSPISFMNAIMQAIGGQAAPGFGVVTRPDGIHLHVDRRAVLPGRLQDMLGISRLPGPPARTRSDDPQTAVKFGLGTTRSRWQEEARVIFSNQCIERTQRIVNSILKALVPPAIEEEKQRRKQAEEERKRLQAEQAEKERQDRIAAEEKERQRKQKEEEEAARLQAEKEQQEAERQAAGVDEPMEDVQETTTAEAAGPSTQPEAQPAEPTRRVHTNIRGRQLDITGLEIDPEYLEALPEELREEVIMQQLSEQRSQAAAAGEEDTEINQEFLEALPVDIREELLQQEAADRRRRERETARRQAAASGGTGGAGGVGGAASSTQPAEEMDALSFLATLDPSLRQAVLADQPEDVLATLGPEYLTEARGSGRRMAQFGDMGALDHRQRIEPATSQGPKKEQRRQIVQMLDKAGVATLLRLMFMPLHGNARHQLNDILHNVCENRQNRSEVISLLLSVLQDGSVDSTAIERSFSHLSLRAKAPGAQKTPQPNKRSLALQTASSVSSEVTPLMVIQQCLATLSFLSQFNPHIAWFFLTEHDSSSSAKLKALRKGKGKENRANKFALNALLSLLDRKLIMESPNCMEQLSALLSSITQPLTVLLRREKERQEEEKGKKPEQAQVEGPTDQAPEGADSSMDTSMTDAPLPTVEIPGATGQEATETGETASAEVKKSEESKQPAEDEKRKKRTIEPPVVPDHNFRLVVHILAARECNGKTFRDTLSTINNLSAVPGARDVIGNELVAQAQALSDTILGDLADLLPHIHQAKTGTDMQGLALAKFSPASSDQAKLLRILTALDYLFDPTRVDKSKGTEPESAPKEDVLKRLYESATFGPLWTKLSDCLGVIKVKKNMLNVATILLPLIEALMVVCKNTTLKDQPLSRGSRELSVNSAPADTGLSMENIFFRFTEEHRKILNELVRQNPRLMSGTFSLLVKNPKVLEFDNKRNYFTRRVHSRGAEPRHPHPPLQLSVRRAEVFLDSFKSLYFKTADELKYGKLNVRFHGEEGVDAGGVTREWFQVLARGMFNPNYALFIPVAADRTTFHPNRLSGVNAEHLMFFKFIGRIIGKALYEGRVLDCHFSRAVYKNILGRSVSIKDMETLDLDYYKSLLWMLENDITDIITETFSIETDDFGEKQVIDLKPGGQDIPVTQENKEEYVQRVVEYRLVESVREQLDNFLKGFHEIIPPDLISIFNEQELELLISGLPEIDVDEWKNHTEYHNYSASSSQIQWFWRAVRSFDKEERAKLLQFVTGTSKVPLNGFKELEGMNGVSKFNIHRDYGNKDRLPSSHTCFNQLDLPEYESYEDLRQRLYTAMTAGSEYFGFA